MKDAKDSYALRALAEGLSAVAAGLAAEDVARAAATLVQAMKGFKDLPTLWALAQVLTSVSPAETPTRSATAAAAVASLAGTGDPLASLALLIPAAEPPPCRLATQQLVELLKMPTCIGGARRVVLDQLGNRYRRTFADMWEFVRFAEEQKLGLDLTSPPRKPEPAVAPPPR
jgi:hypothetical protein